MDANRVHDILSKKICYHPEAIVIDQDLSIGSWLFDLRDGTEYLDLFSQFASQPLGWNHPKLLAQQDRLGRAALYKIANPDMYSVELAQFVEAWSSITPDFDHHFFIDTGTLAVENALKAAFDWKAQLMGLKQDSAADELQVIHFTQAFHGRSGYTLSLTNNIHNPLKTKFFPKWQTWPRIGAPRVIEHNLRETERLEGIALDDIRWHLAGGKMAAIIIETIQGEGGDNHFRGEFLRELRTLASDNEAMLIFDEVQCGIGLTGKMWAYEHFDVVPDIIAFGKKSQVCGISSTSRIDLVIDNVFENPSRINSTWGGNTVDMVRATILIEIIKEENLVQNAALVGSYFLEKLKTLGFENTRGRGLMIAFDVKDKPERDALIHRMKQNRILALACGGRSIRFRPHLTFSQQDADEAVERIRKSI